MAAGYAVPHLALKQPWVADNHSFLLRWLAGIDGPGDEDSTQAVVVFRDWLAKLQAPNVVLSGEEASGFTEAQWAQVSRVFAPFMDEKTAVHCVSFVRHPLHALVSHKNQFTKAGHPYSVHTFPGLYKRHVMASGTAFLGAPWPGRTTATVLSYEEAMAVGIWPCFLRHLGLAPAAFPTADGPRVPRNVSVSIESRWILGGLPPEVAQAPEVFNTVAGLPGTKDGLSAAEAAWVWQELGEEVNAWLRQRDLPKYEFEAPLVDVGSPDLWPMAYVLALTQRLQNRRHAEMTWLRRAVDAIAVSHKPAKWHPDARRRFNMLLGETTSWRL
jgi:hypothetical protein